MPNITNAPLILDALQRYMNESQRWEELNNDTKINRARYIKKCAEIIGNLPIDQIIPTHVRKIQKHFHDRINKNGKPTGRKTIMNYTSAMSNLLKFCKQDLWNQDVSPPQPYITFNYFSDVDMTGYGAKVRHYEALKPDQLEALFKLDMEKNSRLILCIAITTGMRMEEIIGLKHYQFKMGSRAGEEHIRYFDLTDFKTKNDRYAKRNVPLPEILEIPFKPDQKENTGMIFAEYEQYISADGKVSKRGTRVLNEGLVHKVRYNKDDDRKVFHSLRHNLSGAIDNLQNPAVSITQKEWIVGHGMKDGMSESDSATTYNADPELTVKYNILQRIKHPYLVQ
jgi:integrase